MRRDPSAETGYFSEPDLIFRSQEEAARAAAQKDEQVVPRPGYLVELCGEPIPLDLIEYRILIFLARKPYKAYTKKQIVDAVNTAERPVTEQTLDQHVQTLRQKLGLFSDYVQSVPYVGYRFKA